MTCCQCGRNVVLGRKREMDFAKQDLAIRCVYCLAVFCVNCSKKHFVDRNLRKRIVRRTVVEEYVET